MDSSKKEQLPIACILPEQSQRERAAVGAGLFGGVQQVKELPDGYAFCFPGGDQWAVRVFEFIMAERECCPFFTFGMTFEPGQAAIWLALTGPDGTKEFVRGFLGAATRGAEQP